jgi:hypothetical protein
MPLPKWDWPNPLTPFLEDLEDKLPPQEKEDFEGAIVRYNLKYNHLSVIWARLSASVLIFDARSKIMMDAAKRNGRLSSEERKLMHLAVEAGIPYSLDYEDFFIHSKILLDRAVYFIRFFYPELKDVKEIKDVTTDFTGYRLFFLRTVPYRRDEDYARYIRENTAWYESTLRNYRNNFVIHDKDLIGAGTVHNPGESPRPIRRPAKLHSEEESKEQWEVLLALRERYLEVVPKLKNTPLNTWEVLDVLDSNSALLRPEDRAILNRLHLFLGGKMPDLSNVLNSILEFLRFMTDNFEGSDPVGSNPRE